MLLADFVVLFTPKSPNYCMDPRLGFWGKNIPIKVIYFFTDAVSGASCVISPLMGKTGRNRFTFFLSSQHQHLFQHFLGPLETGFLVTRSPEKIELLIFWHKIPLGVSLPSHILSLFSK